MTERTVPSCISPDFRFDLGLVIVYYEAKRLLVIMPKGG